MTAVAVLLLGGVVTAAVINRRRWAWGDFPTWVLAVTTLLAFTAAALAAVVAYRLYRVESARDERAADDRRRAESERAAQAEASRRAQANSVVAWFDKQLPELPALPITWGAIVSNASNLPILDVTIAFHLVSESTVDGTWKPIYRGALRGRIPVIPPGAHRFMPIPEDIRSKHDRIGRDIYVVGIGFTDAAGNRWERDPRGTLKDG